MSGSSNMVDWIGSAGVVENQPSPNHRARKPGAKLQFVIIHGTWMTSDAEAIARLCDAQAEVSSHYYIDRAGKLSQLVSESEVAFHAGKSSWQEVEGLNEFSLGIEIGNAGPFKAAPQPGAEARITPQQWREAEPYTAAQYQTLIGLLKDILQRNPGISAARVLGHSQVSPGRKTDPGAHFEWSKLVDAGVFAPAKSV